MAVICAHAAKSWSESWARVELSTSGRPKTRVLAVANSSQQRVECWVGQEGPTLRPCGDELVRGELRVLRGSLPRNDSSLGFSPLSSPTRPRLWSTWSSSPGWSRSARDGGRGGVPHAADRPPAPRPVAPLPPGDARPPPPGRAWGREKHGTSQIDSDRRRTGHTRLGGADWAHGPPRGGACHRRSLVAAAARRDFGRRCLGGAVQRPVSGRPARAPPAAQPARQLQLRRPLSC